MSYTTEDIESAVRQAFRAGWWRRGKEPAFCVSVERRNELEDIEVPALMERFETPTETGAGNE